VIEELGSPLSLAVSLDLVDLVRGRLELQREKEQFVRFRGKGRPLSKNKL
jgi:hypothetical protein